MATADSDRVRQALRVALALNGQHDTSDVTARLVTSELTTSNIGILADVLEGTYPGTTPADPAPGPAPRIRGRGTRSTHHKEKAKKLIEKKTNAPLSRVRGDTYETGTGKTIHIRSNKPYPQSGGQASYWFGLQADKWVDGDIFVLVCGDDTILIVPVEEMKKYRRLIATAKEGKELQPLIWRTGSGVFELRRGGEHIDFSQWRNRFDLI